MPYKVQAKKNPLKDGEVKYYSMVALSKEPMRIDSIISEIVESTGVTRPVVKTIIAALEQRIVVAMRDSNSFRIGAPKSFRPTSRLPRGAQRPTL